MEGQVVKGLLAMVAWIVIAIASAGVGEAIMGGRSPKSAIIGIAVVVGIPGLFFLVVAIVKGWGDE